MGVLQKLMIVAVVFAAAALARPLEAAQSINRCRSASGGLVFTDQQCNLLGTAYRIEGHADPVQRARPGPHRAGTTPLGFRFGIGCAARTPEGMLGAVRAAIESGDVNQLAGLYDWNGAHRGPAMGVVRRMQNLVKRDLPTIEFDYPDHEPLFALGEAGPAVHPARIALPDVVVANSDWGNSGSAADERFSLRRESGCIWLAG